ncbi:MAG: Uma2 family endonuclease [Planctomycetes bacterium]|nr:Uma2 family endonuclease [Planctomycetota bacterium]
MSMPGLHVGDVEVPFDVQTLDGFRAWMARVEDRAGRASFIQGDVYLDMNAQSYDSHEPVAGEVNAVLRLLARELGTGRHFVPPSWITWPAAGLSTEPDGFFARYETLRSGRLAVHPQRRHEMVVVPDFVLEIVSASSALKDRVRLLGAYAEAGVGEYWLVDARDEARPPELRVLVLRGDAYEDVAPDAEGWVASPTWARAFRLRRLVDPVGLPEFRLDVR